ncbi:hypothetical protein BJX63DRAFT_406941 [Aspergillus granulosus]|uniref:N-acetyltransferase domain-containing protein n=1 Tax=Aspergillus granulosus TaxID=176169 RepID=A0ABR4H0T3_9EURO
MSGPETLNTDRLCLCQFLWSNLDHCTFLAELETTLQIPNGRPEKTAIRSSNDAKQSLYHDHQFQWSRHGYGTYVILLKITSLSQKTIGQAPTDPRYYTPIGKICLTTWDPSSPIHATELFVSIIPDYQGHGYATEATRALLDFLRAQYKLTEFFGFAVLGTPYTDAARAFARKLGLRERGLAKRYHSNGMILATMGIGKETFLHASTPLMSDGDLMDVELDESCGNMYFE